MLWNTSQFLTSPSKLRAFRQNNPHSPINLTFIVPFDTNAPWWHMLSGEQIITPAPIVLIFSDQSTITAALFSTVAAKP
jgi:hypothetical protein